jgi:hypothetical protein
VYDSPLQQRAYIITFIVLSCVTAGCWILYLNEVLFRSGKIRTPAAKRWLADIFLILLVASVACFAMIVGSRIAAHAFHR